MFDTFLESSQDHLAKVCKVSLMPLVAEQLGITMIWYKANWFQLIDASKVTSLSVVDVGEARLEAAQVNAILHALDRDQEIRPRLHNRTRQADLEIRFE
ncbi:MAG: hypothetical protein R3A45_04750 [Bdellovibrionota bacterium]